MVKPPNKQYELPLTTWLSNQTWFIASTLCDMLIASALLYHVRHFDICLWDHSEQVVSCRYPS